MSAIEKGAALRPGVWQVKGAAEDDTARLVDLNALRSVNPREGTLQVELDVYHDPQVSRFMWTPHIKTGGEVLVCNDTSQIYDGQLVLCRRTGFIYPQ